MDRDTPTRLVVPETCDSLFEKSKVATIRDATQPYIPFGRLLFVLYHSDQTELQFSIHQTESTKVQSAITPFQLADTQIVNNFRQVS